MKLNLDNKIVEIVAETYNYKETILKETIETFEGTEEEVNNKIKSFTKYQTYISIEGSGDNLILTFRNKIEMANPQSKEDFVDEVYTDMILNDIKRCILYLKDIENQETIEELENKDEQDADNLINEIIL